MRLTKIYTKIGDAGKTMLASGEKIAKSEERIEAYGSVDELNANVASLSDSMQTLLPDLFQEIQPQLKNIQNLLFDIGGELSFSPEKTPTYVQNLKDSHVEALELHLDKMNSELQPLKNFILPGGMETQSRSHLARTVCRRAERAVVRLQRQEKVRPEILKYLNRLSDWLFVLGRYINLKTNTPELLWEQTKS